MEVVKVKIVPYVNDMEEYLKAEDVDAQFSIDHEQLAFRVRPELGEIDSYTVYPKPDVKILQTLRECKTRTELWDHLPTELGYHG